MKKLISGLVTSVIVFSPVFASATSVSVVHSLSVGSKGPEVMALQELLLKLGHLKGSATGYFGNLTRIALMAYQRANGLAQVGSTGPKTRIFINAALAQSKAPLPPPSVSGTTTNTVPPPPPVSLATTSPATTTVVVPPPPPATAPDASPVVTLISPGAVLPRSTTDFEFAVATDKPTTCRYGTQSGMTLAYMTSFVDTTGTRHSKIMTGLSSDGLYIYYVKCEDTQGRASNELTVTFSLTGH